MPAYPRVFPIDDLMRVERDVWDASEGTIKDGLTPGLGESNEDPATKNLIDDWRSILMSFRARKFKDSGLAQRLIISTDHPGYHFFKR